jgi:hypothetical protein
MLFYISFDLFGLVKNLIDQNFNLRKKHHAEQQHNYGLRCCVDSALAQEQLKIDYAADGDSLQFSLFTEVLVILPIRTSNPIQVLRQNAFLQRARGRPKRPCRSLEGVPLSRPLAAACSTTTLSARRNLLAEIATWTTLELNHSVSIFAFTV